MHVSLWWEWGTRPSGYEPTLLIHVGSVLVVDHVIEICHLALGVCDDWELEIGAGDLIDVLDPVLV